MIGPIRGEMSIAPMMTAVELTFKPSDATKMAKMRIHKLVPLKTIPDSMEPATELNASFSSPNLNLLKKFVKEYRLLRYVYM